MTIDEELGKVLDKIGDKEFCRSKPEVVRRLVKLYLDTNKLSRTEVGLYKLRFSGLDATPSKTTAGSLHSTDWSVAVLST